MPVSTLGGGGSSQKSQVHVFPPTPSIDTHQTSPGQMPVWTAPDDRKEIGVSGPDNARHIRSNVPEAFSRAFSELATIRSEHTVGRNLGSLGAPRLNSRHQSRSPVPLPCGKITDPAARYPSKLPAFARDG